MRLTTLKSSHLLWPPVAIEVGQAHIVLVDQGYDNTEQITRVEREKNF